MREQYRIRSTGGRTIGSDKPLESHALESHALESHVLTDRGANYELLKIVITS